MDHKKALLMLQDHHMAFFGPLGFAPTEFYDITRPTSSGSHCVSVSSFVGNGGFNIRYYFRATHDDVERAKIASGYQTNIAGTTTKGQWSLAEMHGVKEYLHLTNWVRSYEEIGPLVDHLRPFFADYVMPFFDNLQTASDYDRSINQPIFDNVYDWKRAHKRQDAPSGILAAHLAGNPRVLELIDIWKTKLPEGRLLNVIRDQMPVLEAYVKARL